MPTVQLQFVLGRQLSSRLIAWWGQGYSGWSHVDAVLPDGRLMGARSDRVGGQPAGFYPRPPWYEGREGWLRVRRLALPVSANVEGVWVDSLMRKNGAAYDQTDILGLIIGRPLMEQGHWICSAAQLDTLREIGIARRTALTPQQCPPNMLSALFEEIGAVEVPVP